MTDKTQSRAPGRPFDREVEDGLLRAAQDHLVEVGFDRLTVEAVARRCGAGKASVYRRWPGKTELAAAATAALFPVATPPFTGDLRDDLLVAGCALVDGGDRGRNHAVLASVLTAGRHHPDLRDLVRDQVGEPYAQLFVDVLTAAADRGAIAQDTDIAILSDVVPTLAFHRIVARGEPFDEASLWRVVDAVLLPALKKPPELCGTRSGQQHVGWSADPAPGTLA